MSAIFYFFLFLYHDRFTGLKILSFWDFQGIDIWMAGVEKAGTHNQQYLPLFCQQYLPLENAIAMRSPRSRCKQRKSEIVATPSLETLVTHTLTATIPEGTELVTHRINSCAFDSCSSASVDKCVEQIRNLMQLLLVRCTAGPWVQILNNWESHIECIDKIKIADNATAVVALRLTQCRWLTQQQSVAPMTASHPVDSSMSGLSGSDELFPAAMGQAGICWTRPAIGSCRVKEARLGPQDDEN